MQLIRVVPIIAAITVMGGVIWYIANTNPDISETPQISTQTNFQHYLAQQCKKEDSDYISYTLMLDALPITFDPEVIHVSDPAKQIRCLNPEKGNGFIRIIDDEQHDVYLYDESSERLNPDRFPPFGQIGVDVGNENDILTMGYLNSSPYYLFLNEVDLSVRSEKKIQSNGLSFSVSMDRTLLKPGDPRLIEILKPMSQPSSDVPGEDEVNLDEQKYRLVIDQFFGPSSKLSEIEEQVVDQINQQLTTVKGV